VKKKTDSKCPVCNSLAVMETAEGGIAIFCSKKANHAGMAMAIGLQGATHTDKELFEMAGPQLLQWWSDNIAGKLPVEGEVP
jgi:hypothetical protein